MDSRRTTKRKAVQKVRNISDPMMLVRRPACPGLLSTGLEKKEPYLSKSHGLEVFYYTHLKLFLSDRAGARGYCHEQENHNCKLRIFYDSMFRPTAG